VLLECNPILKSELTAAATQLFSRDVRKWSAFFSTWTIALLAIHTPVSPRVTIRT